MFETHRRLYRHHTVASIASRFDFSLDMLGQRKCFVPPPSPWRKELTVNPHVPTIVSLDKPSPMVKNRLFYHHTVASLASRFDFTLEMLEHKNFFEPPPSPWRKHVMVPQVTPAVIRQRKLPAYKRLYHHHTVASLASRFDFTPDMLEHHDFFEPPPSPWRVVKAPEETPEVTIPALDVYSRLYHHHTVASLASRYDFAPEMLEHRDFFVPPANPRRKGIFSNLPAPTQFSMKPADVFDRLYHHHTIASLASRFDYNPEMMKHHDYFVPPPRNHSKSPSSSVRESDAVSATRSVPNPQAMKIFEKLYRRHTVASFASRFDFDPNMIGHLHKEKEKGGKLSEASEETAEGENPPPEQTTTETPPLAEEMSPCHRPDRWRGKSFDEETAQETPTEQAAPKYTPPPEKLRPYQRPDTLRGKSFEESESKGSRVDEAMLPYRRPCEIRGNSFDDTMSFGSSDNSKENIPNEEMCPYHRPDRFRGTSFEDDDHLVKNKPNGPRGKYTSRKLFASVSGESLDNDTPPGHVPSQGKLFDDSDLDTHLYVHGGKQPRKR